jgi:hypothetical protein
MMPGVHYIEVKKDYSNIKSVIAQLHDVKHCAQIAENAYRDLVQTGKYTYRMFAKKVIDHIKERTKKGRSHGDNDHGFRFMSRYLYIRECLEPVLVKTFYAVFGLRYYTKKLFTKQHT